jgi:hypothetical protein
VASPDTHPGLYERLWDRIDGPWNPGVGVDDCWLWLGAWRSRFGYGRLRERGHNGRQLVAHRVVYEQFWDWLAPHEMARHKCDVPSCCNPFHLEAGSAADNAADRYSHGAYAAA